MERIFLGIVSLFSLADYQAADEIYLHPDSSYVVSDYEYSHHTIIKDGVEKTCFLDEQKRGVCYQACFDNEHKEDNQCILNNF